MQNRFTINYNHQDGIATNPQAKQGTQSQLHLELSGHLATDTKPKPRNP